MNHWNTDLPGATIWAFSLTLAVLTAAMFLSVLVAVPPTAITTGMSSAFRTHYSAVIPQGWNFFTKDLQSNQFGAYHVEGNEAESLLITPQTRIENAWGLTRNQRAQGPEIANLANALPEESWRECDSKLLDCVLDAAGEVGEAVNNTSPIPTVCGAVVLTQQHQRPWSYRGFPSADSPVIESVAAFDINCSVEGVQH